MDIASPSSLDGLADLGVRSGADMRPTLLRILTDLYVQKLTHTPEEERHYSELALRLLDAVDVATRAAVAGKLADHLSPPLGVLQHLSRDVAEVAAPLCAHPLLQPPRPVQATAPQPARRLVSANDTEDDAADPDEPLADVIPAVDPSIAGELNEIFFAADANERRLILLTLDIVAPLPGDIGLARGPLMGQRLEAAALARSRDDFVQHLVHALRIPRTQARRIAHDHLGEPVVAAAKALEVPRDALYRILLFVNSAVGHSVEHVHALAALYDEISRQAAEGMVAIWQALHGTERAAPKYQPVNWNETPVRGRPAAQMQRGPLLAQSTARTKRALGHRGPSSAGSPSAQE
ncbi:MAG: DUF2336 domain-containing protein [Proteobacteria bacterium]|nr:MAG: DUF2336 domain-containing protein [Pseudomonadota bacterium]